MTVAAINATINTTRGIQSFLPEPLYLKARTSLLHLFSTQGMVKNRRFELENILEAGYWLWGKLRGKTYVLGSGWRPWHSVPGWVASPFKIFTGMKLTRTLMISLAWLDVITCFMNPLAPTSLLLRYTAAALFTTAASIYGQWQEWSYDAWSEKKTAPLTSFMEKGVLYNPNKKSVTVDTKTIITEDLKARAYAKTSVLTSTFRMLAIFGVEVLIEPFMACLGLDIGITWASLSCIHARWMTLSIYDEFERDNRMHLKDEVDSKILNDTKLNKKEWLKRVLEVDTSLSKSKAL